MLGKLSVLFLLRVRLFFIIIYNPKICIKPSNDPLGVLRNFALVGNVKAPWTRYLKSLKTKYDNLLLYNLFKSDLFLSKII